MSEEIAENVPVVAFMLAHYPRRAELATFAHLGLDRLPLAITAGLRFWKLLGVGKGRVFDLHADLQRSALFTVWDSMAALKQFEEDSFLMRGMRQRSDELWIVHMLPVRWHGLWGRRDPFVGMTPAAPPESGPWVILTRATIRPTHLKAFLDAVPAVAEHLLQRPQLINSVGVGEAPPFHQATVSLWKTLPAITSFAYGPTPHSEVVRRTRREGWYREELFARFRPLASSGTWDGVDPLANRHVFS
jgi:hypothetical protein